MKVDERHLRRLIKQYENNPTELFDKLISNEIILDCVSDSTVFFIETRKIELFFSVFNRYKKIKRILE